MPPLGINKGVLDLIRLDVSGKTRESYIAVVRSVAVGIFPVRFFEAPSGNLPGTLEELHNNIEACINELRMIYSKKSLKIGYLA